MNQREQKNEEREEVIKQDGKKKDKINESEKQKALIEIANDKEFREENLDNIDEFGAETNLINRLDNDCLAKILSYVPLLDRLEMEKVCEKWKEAVAMSWSNVKKLDTVNLQILIQKRESTLKELLNNCCQYLTHLTIDYQYSWMTDVLKNNCKNIINFDVELKLSKYSHSLCEIIESMTKLKILKVKGPDEFDFLHLWNELIEILPADIEEIHLIKVDSDFFSWDNPACCLVLDKFKNLRCLTLGIFYLTRATIESILLNKNSLIYLNLNSCRLPVESQKIFSQLVNLEHLELGGVKNFKNNIITEIAHNCHKLKYLSVNGLFSSSIQGSIFRELKYLNNLEHLDFPLVEKSDDGNDNIIADVVDNCKKLKCLNVEQGRNFTTLDIEAITKLNNLQYLNLAWVEVDSQSFINIANNCLKLKEIKMNFKIISEIALEKLTNLKKLEKLKLVSCYYLTGNLLSKIVDNCKNLVDLHLGYCDNLTEDSLIKVGKLDNLKILNIHDIENVPIAMFDYFRKLEKLYCSYCPTITDEAIKKVIDNCFNLSLLHVERNRITVDTLVHASKRKFSFKILNILVDYCVHREYLNLNRKSSRYLKINFK